MEIGTVDRRSENSRNLAIVFAIDLPTYLSCFRDESESEREKDGKSSRGRETMRELKLQTRPRSFVTMVNESLSRILSRMLHILDNILERVV